MLKKVAALSLAISLSASIAYADVTEIKCDTNPVFAQYSCNQCFDGGEKSEWEHIGLLSDIWKNTSANKKMMYKETQEMPEMISLDTSKANWSQVPSSDSFWEYTPDLEALADGNGGYILEPGKDVTWLKSKLDAAYKLDKNEVAKGEGVGLLVYKINTNSILDSGEVSSDVSEHNECVLYKSGSEAKKPTPPTKLPQTGPEEFFLLLILAMVLGFGIVKFRKAE